MTRTLALAFIALASSYAAAQDCTQYNYIYVWNAYDPSNNSGHVTLNHTVGTNTATSCSYESVGSRYRETLCDSYGSAFGNDTGSITPVYDAHYLGAVVNGGESGAVG